MAETADVIVLGLGAMGSSTAYQLARRGSRVIGFDRFHPPHEMGSSHGRARIIREAYHEGPSYVPIVQRSYELWDELEQASGEQLFRKLGGLIIGPPDGKNASGSRQSAQTHGLEHEVLSADEVRRRYPLFNPNDDWVGVYEARSGALFPEKCIEANLALAAKAGAELHFDEQVTEWHPDGDGVRVTTAAGSYRADRLVITAGAWLPKLVSRLNLPLRVERQVMLWFEPVRNADMFLPENCPNTGWEYEPGQSFYCQPNFGAGYKVAQHHGGPDTDPDTLVRKANADDEEQVRALLAKYISDANGRLLSAAVCMYTDTPDYDFLMDFHPAHPQVIIGSPCSGHGFKFAAVVGEILADLATEGRSRFDLDMFGIDRLLK
ncbi:MAG: N-methyl-L-tryptophan oxidase [Dehalococcoidia bacterium]